MSRTATTLLVILSILTVVVILGAVGIRAAVKYQNQARFWASVQQAQQVALAIERRLTATRVSREQRKAAIAAILRVHPPPPPSGAPFETLPIHDERGLGQGLCGVSSDVLPLSDDCQARFDFFSSLAVLTRCMRTLAPSVRLRGEIRQVLTARYPANTITDTEALAELCQGRIDLANASAEHLTIREVTR